MSERERERQREMDRMDQSERKREREKREKERDKNGADIRGASRGRQIVSYHHAQLYSTHISILNCFDYFHGENSDFI